ncbi:MAG: hypothetical protein CMI18_02310 [Opitutaceae bacterium]|nr:hypothetical protein [Opitutaceae bacterium]
MEKSTLRQLLTSKTVLLDRNSDLAEIGYARGVPLGGDLVFGHAGRSPRFLIRAVKDPDAAHLDRIQVVKR